MCLSAYAKADKAKKSGIDTKLHCGVLRDKEAIVAIRYIDFGGQPSRNLEREYSILM